MRLFRLVNATAIFLFVVMVSCNSSSPSSKQGDNNETPSSKDLQVGGLYVIADKDSNFYAVKILALDDFAVHLRTYEDKFKDIPSHINSDSLKVLIGHSPIDKQGLLADHPQLINVEKVSSEELEGYKIYLEEMKKNSQ